LQPIIKVGFERTVFVIHVNELFLEISHGPITNIAVNDFSKDVPGDSRRFG
jgi:hypothetical protein